MALPGLNLKSDMDYIVRLVEVNQGKHPVRIDIKNDVYAYLSAMITGMRTVHGRGCPVFIDSTITTGHYNYYLPSAPYTAVDASY